MFNKKQIPTEENKQLHMMKCTARESLLCSEADLVSHSSSTAFFPWPQRSLSLCFPTCNDGGAPPTLEVCPTCQHVMVAMSSLSSNFCSSPLILYFIFNLQTAIPNTIMNICMLEQKKCILCAKGHLLHEEYNFLLMLENKLKRHYYIKYKNFTQAIYMKNNETQLQSHSS